MRNLRAKNQFRSKFSQNCQKITVLNLIALYLYTQPQFNMQLYTFPPLYTHAQLTTSLSIFLTAQEANIRLVSLEISIFFIFVGHFLKTRPRGALKLARFLHGLGGSTI